MNRRSELRRSLSLTDAVAIGVASMVGAGVFVVWQPAAVAAGPLLLVALVIAALVAWANATSSAQLAAQYPAAGGTYVYGRERLGPWPGFLAGINLLGVTRTAQVAKVLASLALIGILVALAVGWLRDPAPPPSAGRSSPAGHTGCCRPPA